ncbi:MAG: hypothetical protein R3343_05870 [Nitriliruptorales bacterium]|nr:hypothetical protein [Nitriliruptorales bacterium]
MTDHERFIRARRRVMTVWGFALTLDVAGYSLLLVDHLIAPGDAYEFWLEPLIGGVFFYTVGILIHWRYPHHRVGHAFLVGSLAGAVQTALGAYAHFAEYARPDLPFEAVAAIVSTLAQFGFVMSLLLLLFLFPTGTLVSPRWRLALGAFGVGVLLESLTTTFRPGPLDIGGVANPLAWSAANDVLVGLDPVRTACLAIAVVAALASPIVRYRRSTGLERLQLRWFAFGATAAFLLILSPLSENDTAGSVIWGVAPGLLPAFAGIAILRYRLYDLGLVVRRTVTYAILVAILVAVYVAVVLSLGAVARTLLGEDSDLVVAASTLVAAALFQPLRGRVQRHVDNRFDRARAGTEATVHGFGRVLRDQIDVAQLRRDLERTAATVARPRSVALWLAPTVTTPGLELVTVPER